MTNRRWMTWLLNDALEDIADSVHKRAALREALYNQRKAA